MNEARDGLRLIPIRRDGSADVPEGRQSAYVEEVKLAQTKFYARVGYEEPWIGYFVEWTGEIIGSCAFKGAPEKNCVEIAYFTFPRFEGRGLATRVCGLLTDLAFQKRPDLIVAARTLPQENASTKVLTKNGFRKQGETIDPEDGPVWEWMLRRKEN